MLANILMLLKANEINEQQLSVFYIGLNVISNYMNYKLTQNSNDRSRVKPIHFVFFTLFQNRVIINTFLLYFLPNSLDATKKKKKISLCSFHTISMYKSCKRYYRYYTTIKFWMCFVDSETFVNIIHKAMPFILSLWL